MVDWEPDAKDQFPRNETSKIDLEADFLFNSK